MGFRKIDREALRTLCKNLEISDTEIAERFGVSRNAVSLMIKTLGIPDRGRALVRVRAEKREQRLDDARRQQIFERYPVMREIEMKAKELGIAFEVLLYRHRGIHWFRLGSKVCYILRAKAHACMGRDTYSGIRRPSERRQSYDVVVVQLRTGFLVLPKGKLPHTSTTCVLGRQRIVPGGHNKRHDYQEHFHPDLEWMRTFVN
jgi:transposase